MPMDTKLLARKDKAGVSSVLSAEEEEDQELRLYIHELTNFLVDEVCKRAETGSIKNSDHQQSTIAAMRKGLAASMSELGNKDNRTPQ
jgi:hypothetical protein